jgi:hypothetical protein
MQRILAAADSGPIKPKPGRQYETDIRHDDWCPMLNGQTVCACDPDIFARYRDGNGKWSKWVKVP